MPRLFLSGAFASAILLTPAAAIAEPLLLEIERASAAYDQRTGEAIVTFVMKAGSARAFSELTSRNVGRAMELRIDGRALMKPIIREPILGGSGQVAARFTIDEARDIAHRLQTGASRIELEIVDP